MGTMAEDGAAAAGPPEPAEATPNVAPGEGIVTSLGWESYDDGRPPRFRAIVWFPNGPPRLPISTVWESRPVIITLANASAGSSGEPAASPSSANKPLEPETPRAE